MLILPASGQNPSFFSVSEQKVITNHYIAGWLVGEKGDTIEPVLYPALPKGNTLFYDEGMSTVVNPKTRERFGSRDGACASLVKK